MTELSQHCLIVRSQLPRDPRAAGLLADAHALAPSRGIESSFRCNVRKRAVVIVVIEVIRHSAVRIRRFERRSVDDENVRPSVIVVIENRDARAGGFDNVFLCVPTAKDDRRGEARLLGYVCEVSNRIRGWSRLGALGSQLAYSDDHDRTKPYSAMNMEMPRKTHDPECMVGWVWKVVKAGFGKHTSSRLAFAVDRKRSESRFQNALTC